MKKKKISLTPEQKKEIPIKEVPLKEDVDLEFEYKVYMLFDKLKKYKYLIIGASILFLLGIVGYVYMESEKEKILNKASGLVYDIRKSYIEEDYDKAISLIKEFKEKYSDTPYLKLAVSYEILISKKKNKVKPEDLIVLKEMLESDQLKSGIKEFKAYLLYTENKNKEALSNLEQINQKYYNYISSLLLKGFIIKKDGGNPENIFKQIIEISKYSYFKKIAEENL
ncbi:tetratricopeptide repeat protein [Persephonella sp.]